MISSNSIIKMLSQSLLYLMALSWKRSLSFFSPRDCSRKSAEAALRKKVRTASLRSRRMVEPYLLLIGRWLVIQPWLRCHRDRRKWRAREFDLFFCIWVIDNDLDKLQIVVLIRLLFWWLFCHCVCLSLFSYR